MSPQPLGRPAARGPTAIVDPGEEAAPEAAAPPGDAATCASACAAREACIGAGDAAECEQVCLAAQVDTRELVELTRQDCQTVQANEPLHLLFRQEVRTCSHLIECGVKGTIPTCVRIVGKNLEASVYGPEQLAQWEAADCDVLLATVQIDAVAPAPASPAGTGVAPGGRLQ